MSLDHNDEETSGLVANKAMENCAASCSNGGAISGMVSSPSSLNDAAENVPSCSHNKETSGVCYSLNDGEDSLKEVAEVVISSSNDEGMSGMGLAQSQATKDFLISFNGNCEGISGIGSSQGQATKDVIFSSNGNGEDISGMDSLPSNTTENDFALSSLFGEETSGMGYMLPSDTQEIDFALSSSFGKGTSGIGYSLNDGEDSLNEVAEVISSLKDKGMSRIGLAQSQATKDFLVSFNGSCEKISVVCSPQGQATKDVAFSSNGSCEGISGIGSSQGEAIKDVIFSSNGNGEDISGMDPLPSNTTENDFALASTFVEGTSGMGYSLNDGEDYLNEVAEVVISSFNDEGMSGICLAQSQATKDFLVSFNGSGEEISGIGSPQGQATKDVVFSSNGNCEGIRGIGSSQGQATKDVVFSSNGNGEDISGMDPLPSNTTENDFALSSLFGEETSGVGYMLPSDTQEIDFALSSSFGKGTSGIGYSLNDGEDSLNEVAEVVISSLKDKGMSGMYLAQSQATKDFLVSFNGSGEKISGIGSPQGQATKDVVFSSNSSCEGISGIGSSQGEATKDVIFSSNGNGEDISGMDPLPSNTTENDFALASTFVEGTSGMGYMLLSDAKAIDSALSSSFEKGTTGMGSLLSNTKETDFALSSPYGEGTCGISASSASPSDKPLPGYTRIYEMDKRGSCLKKLRACEREKKHSATPYSMRKTPSQSAIHFQLPSLSINGDTSLTNHETLVTSTSELPNHGAPGPSTNELTNFEIPGPSISELINHETPGPFTSDTIQTSVLVTLGSSTSELTNYVTLGPSTSELTNHGAPGPSTGELTNFEIPGPSISELINNETRGLFISDTIPNSETPSAGIRNNANSCFMNTVLQCLSHTVLLSNYIYETAHNENENSPRGTLLMAFDELLNQLWSPAVKIASTEIFQYSCAGILPGRFFSVHQQDAHEFMRYIIDRLHTEVRQPPERFVYIYDPSIPSYEQAEQYWQSYIRTENSYITEMFAGMLQSSLECIECHHTSLNFDIFLDISLSIPQSISSMHSLHCLLQNFTEPEILDGSNKPTCEKCRKPQKMVKRYRFHKLPKCLIIQLKRFAAVDGVISKICSDIEFPIYQLNMNPYMAHAVQDPSIYNLYAVSNHFGSTVGGHYTAICKHPMNGRWYNFNDSMVGNVLMPPINVVSKNAYILFYEKEDVD